MATNKLTEKFCRTAPQGKHFDGGGGYLQVDKHGKYWRQKYDRPTDGKEDTLAHGVYPHVTLAEFREKLDAAKKLIRAGVDPKAQRREAEAALKADPKIDAANTLYAEVAEAFYENKHRPWSAEHRRDVRRIIDKELLPSLGKLAMKYIKEPAVQAMFDPIIERGVLTFARDVRMYFRAIWNYYNRKIAKEGEELRDPSLRIDLPNAPRERGHPALPLQEIGEFQRKLQYSDASVIVRIAVKMLLVTDVRTKPLRLATWDEFDIKAALWRIPADHMKGAREHIVPLSRQALALLQMLRPYTGGKPYLFPNGRDDDRPMSENAVLACIKRMGYQGRMTGHGMRSMFSTWAHETGYSSDAIERQMAHAPKDKVKAAYLRSEFLKQRTEILQAWADWLDAQAATADVIQLHQVR